MTLLNLPATLAIARYRYTFALTRAMHAPAYAGSALRGAFGHALRRACVPRGHAPSELLLQNSPYTRIFAPPPRPDIGLTTPDTVPPPYLIEPEHCGERREHPVGSRFHFCLVLIGDARHQLPLISYAWQQAFNSRDGIAQGRGELVDIAVERPDGWESIYADERITPHSNTITLPEALPEAVTLRILTPLRLQQNGRALGIERLTAQILLTQLLRRITLVCRLYFNLEPQADFSALKNRAAATRSRPELRWYDWQRYSNRQQQTMHLGGALGSWQLENLAPEHARALQIGQWLHVGKNTTFGLGRYIVTENNG